MTTYRSQTCALQMRVVEPPVHKPKYFFEIFYDHLFQLAVTVMIEVGMAMS